MRYPALTFIADGADYCTTYRRKATERLSSAHRWVQTINAAEIEKSMRGAGKRAAERQADGPRELTNAKAANRQISTQNMAKTRGFLEGSARELSHVRDAMRGASTQKMDRKTGLLRHGSSMLIGRRDEARERYRVATLKATATIAVATRRMQDLATTAQKVRYSTKGLSRSRTAASVLALLRLLHCACAR